VGNLWGCQVLCAFDLLIAQGRNPVSRAINLQTPSVFTHTTQACHFQNPLFRLKRPKKTMKGGIEMTEDEKHQVTVFRFGVISDFVNATELNNSQRQQLLVQK
jgi:hypothetical protein